MESFHLEVPYKTAYEETDSFQTVFLIVETNSSIHGFSSVSPDRLLTGETAEDVMENLTNLIEPLLLGLDLGRYIYILETIRKMTGDRPATLCLIDTLLYDLMAKLAGLPLYQYLGGYREYIPTSVTVGILPLDETMDMVSGWVQRGYGIIKLKGGQNVFQDIEKANRIREMFGRELVIRFDANQGYTVADAIKFINGTRKAGIELLEQPTPRENMDWLGYVTRRTDVLVLADESLMNLKDALILSRDGMTDLINIKLVKVGGITEALHINSVAKSAGIKVMVGCFDECALGIAAGLHFALSRPNIAYADLDGHLGVLNDPTSGAVEIRNGILYPGSGPGLGFDLPGS